MTPAPNAEGDCASSAEKRGTKRRKVDGRGSTQSDRDSIRVNADGEDQTAGPEEEGRACISCRRRKTKCSRQQPCSQCSKLGVECAYDDSRERPGPKPGAIESLTQKVAALEHMLLGQGILLEPLLKQAATDVGKNKQETSVYASARPALSETTARLKDAYIKAANGESVHWMANTEPEPIAPSPPYRTSGGFGSDDLLVDVCLAEVIDIYFNQVHPWLPILHEETFRARFNDDAQRQSLNVILQAMTSLCLRFVRGSPADRSERKEKALHCRQRVILQGMEYFSVENLQALIIITFDIIGSGNGPSSWSVVGSMSRTVEHLQLNVEDNRDDDQDTGKRRGKRTSPLITRMKFLPPPSNWLQSEERRRVFWNVFLMDRFCSVATGWNNSLTGIDVHRRLPCEGTLWRIGRPVTTPHFGLAQSVGATNAPIGHLALSPASERASTDGAEMEAIGGFAFAIEATENLNLVTNFFLQHSIDMEDSAQSQEWLLKFKELDLRLIRWRLSLPTKWRTACVLNQDGIIDPNLTLAHMIHNTAVIQLHQAVAYAGLQSRHQRDAVRLPSMSSAETCINAAQEISIMALKFLGQSTGMTSPLFSFCLFISGRALLAHTAYYPAEGQSIGQTIEQIINSLKDISSRWSGSLVHDDSLNSDETERNLASRFRERLERMRSAGSSKDAQNSLDIRQPAYSEPSLSQTHNAALKASHASGNFLPSANEHSVSDYQLPVGVTMDGGAAGTTPDSLSLACPPLPAAFEPYNMYNTENLLHLGQYDSQALMSYPQPPPSFDTSTGVDGDTAFDLTGYIGDDDQQLLRVSRFSSSLPG